MTYITLITLVNNKNSSAYSDGAGKKGKTKKRKKKTRTHTHTHLMGSTFSTKIPVKCSASFRSV